jgi:glycerophosphoryl diester phosphodiesterase
MLSILAHRGFWQSPKEKNSPEALCRALSAGYGVETDLRDFNRELVIAHDLAEPGAQTVDGFFACYAKSKSTAPLALNIKADGLRRPLKTGLQKHSINNYFCFDMSVPETLNYMREGLRFFTRESEIETAPVLYDAAAGVWLDMFKSDWVTPAVIERHLLAGKQVALVSPELHQRPHLPFWNSVRMANLGNNPSVLLCTDYPKEAWEFFHD